MVPTSFIFFTKEVSAGSDGFRAMGFKMRGLTVILKLTSPLDYGTQDDWEAPRSVAITTPGYVSETDT